MIALTSRLALCLASISCAAALSAATYRVQVDGFTTGEPDMDGGGEVQTRQAGVSFGVDAGDYRQGGLYAGELGYSLRHYDVSDWDYEGDFEQMGLSLRYATQLQGRWGLTGFGAASFGQGEEGDWGEGGRYMVAALADYSFSPTLTVSFGAAYMTRLGESNRVLPLVAIRWQIDGRWALRTYDGVYVSYDVTGDGQQSLELFAKWQSDTYSVGEAPNGRESYLDDEGFLAGVAYKVALPSGFAVRPYAGYWFSRDMEVRDEDERTLIKRDIDDTWLLGVTASLEF
ncbi:MAG: DUF6268 family outer membrane beta-barrel protein [Verrucomicrobiota bacterium JB022]|nr:DUF6268 family outer membrane beta-barrel protein [Verrucomicrobiota bacterium JB022]